MISNEQIKKAKQEKITVKCVVWDLDHTLWDGVLLEDPAVTLKEGVTDIIRELDRRGILQSISSKNHYDSAKAKLQELGIWEYFLFPQINWEPKSKALEIIAKEVNFSLDTFAFVDDQIFEREEVLFKHPQVKCLDAPEISPALEESYMIPKFITVESSQRRKLYQSDVVRKEKETDFQGSNDEFLATLEMDFRIKLAEEQDLKRAEELTLRTNQLNTTGYTYSYEELEEFRQSEDHLLYVSSLEDKYGSYGTIGLSLVEKKDSYWTIKLLLMSCRVMSRGVGTVMMSYLMNQSKQSGVKIRAEFVPNDRNRMMYVTYKFGGFKEVEKNSDPVIFEHDLEKIQPYPPYLKLQTP